MSEPCRPPARLPQPMWGFCAVWRRFPGCRPGRRRRRSRAGPAPPPREARRLATRAASSGESPWASRAARTEEWVQPDPWAAPSGWRGPGSSTSRSPSKNTSIACSRCPPVTTTAAGPSAWIRRASASDVGLARVVQQGARLGHVRREHGGAGQQQVDQRGARRRVEQLRARLGDHHRIEHDRGRVGQLGQRPRHRLDRDPVAQHPDLDRVHADVARHRADLGHDDLGRDRVDRGDADACSGP